MQVLASAEGFAQHRVLGLPTRRTLAAAKLQTLR